MCFLQVFDGANSEARLLGTYCGTSAPKKVRSTSNVLLVTFFADGTINGNGFNISFSQTGGMLWFHKSNTVVQKLPQVCIYHKVKKGGNCGGKY